MDDQKRTKVLAGILGFVLVCYFGIPIFKGVFLEPVTSREKELERQTVAADAAYKDKMTVKTAEFNLFTWAGRSLPADRETALDVYQTWINDLAVHSGIEITDLVPETRPGEKKVGVFESVLVTVKGSAKQAALQEFLYRFEKVALMQRVARLVMEADGADGEPLFEIEMTLEGVCMADGPQREFLFPRTGLSAEIDEDADTIQVSTTDGFPNLRPDPDDKNAPKPPADFLISLNGEIMRVTDTDGSTWTVERAADDTEAEEHPADSIVRLFPVHPDRIDSKLSDYQTLLDNSPFVKPRPPVTYTPRLIGLSDKTHTRGTDFGQTVRASGFNTAEFGRPVFSLSDSTPPEMTIDAKSGRITWKIPDDTKEGDYPVEVIVKQEKGTVELREKFTVKLIDPNQKPTITVTDRAKVYLGSEITLSATASDDGDESKLKFSGENLPPGAEIAENGEFRWRPETNLTPGDYEFAVVVTDDKGETSKSGVTIEAVEDFAKYTRLTTIAGPVGNQEIHFYNQKSDESTIYRVGNEFAIADIRGRIVKVDFRSIEFESGQRRYRLNAGGYLRSMEDITPAEQEKATDETTEEDDSKPATEQDSKAPASAGEKANVENKGDDSAS